MGSLGRRRTGGDIFGQLDTEGANPSPSPTQGINSANSFHSSATGAPFLLGEVNDRYGHSPRHPVEGLGTNSLSRNGDGRAALGPVLREYW